MIGLPMLIIAKKRNGMLRLWRMVTVSLLVAQLMAGYCCAHHARLCDRPVQSPPMQGEAILGILCSSDCSSSPSEHQHHGHRDCKVGPCSTVLLHRVLSNLSTQSSEAFAVSLHGDPCTVIGIALLRHSSPPSGLLLPVRLHLANQVLLI